MNMANILTDVSDNITEDGTRNVVFRFLGVDDKVEYNVSNHVHKYLDSNLLLCQLLMHAVLTTEEHSKGE